MIGTIKHLLNAMTHLNRHENEIQQITGEQFNIFHILRIGHYEVGTHSPILAELLDPKGRHGQGSRFLELFLEAIKVKPTLSASARAQNRIAVEMLPEPCSASVWQEKSIGNLGRVDILVSDANNRTLIIENKIYAGDQENQITRYLQDSSNAAVIYLTLEGSPPSGFSFDPKKDLSSGFTDRLICLSYKEDILHWLEACRKEVPAVAQVRESLTQYIQLIKNLTGQNPSSRMNDQIKSTIISTPDNLEAYLTLLESKSAVYGELIRTLNDEVTKSLRNGWTLKESLATDGSKWTQYLLTHPSLTQIGLAIALAFEGGDYTKCFFGFRTIDHQNNPLQVPDALKGSFAEKYRPGSATPSWPLWMWWEPQNWDKSVWLGIRSGEFSRKIVDTLNSLAELAEESLGFPNKNLPVE